MLENDRTWKQDYLYRMFSHHTKDKEKENYVVNAIWARLDDLNVKPVTQQYVRRPNGYALIDLYFPQINYGVECDEAYHKDNTLKDAAREIDLQTALSACSEDGLTIRRVDATLDADALHARIREIVCEIKQKVAEKGEQLSPWLEQEEEWRSIKERGILRTEDAYSFKTIADICQKCFGKDANYRIQRSFFHVADDRMLWCPKLAIELPDGSKVAQSRGWINELSADWNVIIEHNDSGAIGKIAEGTVLTRRTVSAILQGIRVDKLYMFRNNPEEFISKVIRLINEQKATMIVEHISYDTIEGEYDSSIFTAEKATQSFDKAFLAKKAIQDYVFTDGSADKSIERKFAEDLDAAEEVCVYAKLPRTFQIPTPVGNYSPDWAIAFYEGTVKHIFFIAETKGTMESLELRPIEQAKISCAKKLFNEMSTSNVVYHDVDSYRSLLSIMSSI